MPHSGGWGNEVEKMEMALVLLAYIIGIAFVILVVLITIAVLKASSDNDDLAERIMYQTKEGLRDRGSIQGTEDDSEGNGKEDGTDP